MRKSLDYLNKDKPFMVLTIFENQNLPGVIFIEAHKRSHVMQLITGVSNIMKKGIEMVSIKAMPQLVQISSEINKNNLKVHQWVRVNKGIYKDDIGLVEFIENNQRALIRLIPRIPSNWYSMKESECNLRKLKHESSTIKIPQKLFNPQLVKNECRKEKFIPLGKGFYVWRNMMFRNGYLFQFFKLSKLESTRVSPSLEEVQKFQVNIDQFEGFESD